MSDPDLTQLSPAALDAWLAGCGMAHTSSARAADTIAALVRYVRTMKDERNSLLLLRRSSDALAKAVLRLVENRRVDARSEAGDALIHWAADRTDNNADPINAFRKLIDDDDDDQPKPGRVLNSGKTKEIDVYLPITATGWRPITDGLFTCRACGTPALMHPHTTYIWGCMKCRFTTASVSLYFEQRIGGAGKEG